MASCIALWAVCEFGAMLGCGADGRSTEGAGLGAAGSGMAGCGIGGAVLCACSCGGGLAFASEVKSLLEVPGVEARLDAVALDQIFTTWAAIGGRTAFEGVREVPPAHILLAERGTITLRPYWVPTPA